MFQEKLFRGIIFFVILLIHSVFLSLTQVNKWNCACPSSQLLRFVLNSFLRFWIAFVFVSCCFLVSFFLFHWQMYHLENSTFTPFRLYPPGELYLILEDNASSETHFFTSASDVTLPILNLTLKASFGAPMKFSFSNSLTFHSWQPYTCNLVVELPWHSLVVLSLQTGLLL